MSQPPKKVFISYSHDSEAHRALVLDLANRLRVEQGFDCQIDQHFLPGFPPDGWIKWMRDQVQNADFVLMVCTTLYRDRYLRNVEEGGRGVGFEGVVISQALYNQYYHNPKFIPIIPASGSLDDVPIDLQGYSTYRLPDDYQMVCDFIRGIQYNPLPPLGNPPVQNSLETRVDAYLDWVKNTFLHSMDAYTAMDGKKRVRAQPQVRLKRFIVEEDFSALDRLRPGYREQQVWEEKTFDNILDALSETGQGVFLGKPGAGKTTTLWKMASDEIVANEQRERHQRVVPIILRLGFWIEPWKSLENFIHDKTNVVEKLLGREFSNLLEQNRILLILDGLNEMPVVQQRDKGRQIREFLTSHKQVRAYASCREDDYSDDVRQPLPELHIQPLSIPRIKTFIRGYLEADAVGQVGEEAENLFWEIAGGSDVREVWQVWEKAGATDEQFWNGAEIPRESPNIYRITSGKQNKIWKKRIRDNLHNLIRLACNPYLLAMMMDICQPGEAFPSNRGALLEGFYQQLVRREFKRQKDHVVLLDDGGKQLEMLIGKLAWAMAEKAQTSSPRYETLAIMEHDEQWLKLAIRCNVLEQIGDNIRFSHQLLQDYFIAVGMKLRLDAGKLLAEQFWQQDGEWWEPTGWEEPVILLAGLYADCTLVVRWLGQVNPKLAARCIRESGVACQLDTRAGLYESWCERLINLETDPNPNARAALGTALAWVDLHGCSLDQRKGVGLDTKGWPDIDWVEIPAGEFIYQDSERVHLETYWMSRYPVTNAQFQAFVMAKDGYESTQWWQGLKKPDSVQESYWKESNRPVEKVNWHESMAFCRWLSAKSGLEIRLPTEQQWEKAACGTDGREYPWGSEFKSEYLNAEGNLGQTCAVGIYPQGQSFYGLMDMAGNVWEWCLNKYVKSEMIVPDLSNDFRVVRGGSWHRDSEGCRSAFRDSKSPRSRGNNRGIRLCCFPH